MQKASPIVLFLATVAILSPAGLFAKETATWTDRLQLSGDMRYRHEGIYVENRPDRVRHRLRIRLAAKAEVNPWVDAYARLASGIGDPISTNQDLSGGFTPKSIWLDRAYVSFRPIGIVTLLAGKFGVPFEHTDLHFDPDLNLEGMAVSLRRGKKDASFDPFVRIGGFWAQERSTGPDQGMFGVQIGEGVSADRGSAVVALAYYDYGNVNGGPLLYNPSNPHGNSIRGSGTSSVYSNDYDLIDVNAQLKLKARRSEFTFTGNVVQNQSPEDKNMAWLAGFAMKTKALHSEWDLSYSYRDLEADALIGAYTDSDFGGGGTDSEGHRLAASISPVSGTRCGATWFVNRLRPDGDRTKYQRLMLDLEVKF